MRVLKSILLAGGALLACAAVAQAADLPTKKTPVAPPPAKVNCDGFWNWFNNSAADCPLSYWGITFYGQVDVGGGYETNAAKFNRDVPQGVSELISKQSHGAAWQGVPNGLSQSNIGVKWKEQIAPDWYFIGDVNFGFDPYSLQFSNGPRSLVDNNTTPAFLQSTNSDSSRTYGPINTRAWAGFSNKTFGTLTYGRHYAFSTDNDNAYDPFGGAYAFSLIGYSSTLGAGLGDTELARFNNSIRYLYADHNIRAGVLSQVGGWSAGNNAQYAIQGDLGFDWQGLSVDGVYSWAKSAVSLATYGKPVYDGIAPETLATNPLTPSTLKATVQNISAFQFVGKYKWNQFTLFGGLQVSEFTNPSSSDLPTGIAFRYFNGGTDDAYGTKIQGNAYPVPRWLDVAWVGGKYTVIPQVDLVAGYYWVHQNDYLGSTQTATGPTSCTAATPDGAHHRYGTQSGKCAGDEEAISGMIDWHATKRFDVYAGAMYSRWNGGLASNAYAPDNLAATAGVRLSF